MVFMTAALNDDIINNVTTTQINPELKIVNIDILMNKNRDYGFIISKKAVSTFLFQAKKDNNCS